MKSRIYEFGTVLKPFPIHVTKDFDVEELKAKYRILNAADEEVAITDEFDANETTAARMVNVVDAESGKLYYLVLLFCPDEIGAGMPHMKQYLANAYLQYLGFCSPAAYNDEPYAYFVQWVTNCIWSVLVDDVDKMNGKLI